MRGARSAWTTARIAGVLCLATAGTAAALTGVRSVRADHGDGHALTLASGHGALVLDSSRPGTAIFGGADLAPGDSVSGDLRLTAPDAFPADVSVSLADLVENLGPAGARLSSVLQLRLVEDPAGSAPRVRYSGLLRDLGTRPLDTYAAGESRTYRLTATLPDTAPAAAMQSTSATASFTWTAQEPVAAPPSPPDAGEPATPGNPGSAAPGDAGDLGAATPGAAPAGTTTTPGTAATPKPPPAATTRPVRPQRPAATPSLGLRLVLPLRQQAHRHGNTVIGWAICSRRCRLTFTGRATDAGRVPVRGRRAVPAMTLRAVPAARGAAARRTRLVLELTPEARRTLARTVTLRVTIWVRAGDAAGHQAEALGTTRVTR